MTYPDGLYWKFTNNDMSSFRSGRLDLPKEMILERDAASYTKLKKDNISPDVVKNVSLDVVKITELVLPQASQPFLRKNDFYDFEWGPTDEIYEITTSDGSISRVIFTQNLGLIKIEEFLETDITLHCRVAKSPHEYPPFKEPKNVPEGGFDPIYRRHFVVVTDSRCGCENHDDKEVHEKKLAAQKDALTNRWHMLQPSKTYML